MAETQPVKMGWLVNLMVGIVGAMMITAVGWLKTSVDSADTRLEGLSQRLERIETQVQDNVARFNGIAAERAVRFLDIEGAINKLEQQREQDQQRVHALERKVDIHQDWIDAHAHADKAIRELH